MRRAAGEPERRLWRALRETLAEAKFRRQVPLGPYHADFCSHAAKPIVEVDGDEHAARAAQDAERTRFLHTEGYSVVRFFNAEVMENIEGVLAPIATAIADKQKGRP